MFSKVWFTRAAASHWLSPSVSIPTSRFTPGSRPLRASSILVRVSRRHVPRVHVLVERRLHVDGIDLHYELHRRLHLEVAGALEYFSKRRVGGECADLVRVGLTRLAVDPLQQRLQRRLVVRIREEVREQRDPA